MGHLLASINPEASDKIQSVPAQALPPDVGELVIYHMRPGERRQGRTRFPALVQGSNERGQLNLTVICEAGELKNESLVEQIGPGRENHVWERPDASGMVEAFRGTITSLHTRIGDQEQRLAAMEKETAALRKIMLGEYDVPRVSFIDILQDFENRLRAKAGGNPKPAAVKSKKK